jgi:hypothetical protein
MRVPPTSLNVSYRGFLIGYLPNPHGFRPCWRSSMEDRWHEGHMLVDTVCEIEKLAREIIDYQYRLEAMEMELGRKLELSELRPDL